MCQVPSSLAGLLFLLRPCFTQPTFQTFSMLLVGSVGRVCDCTITGMLEAAGLAGVWHHSRAHDFFARRRWEPDELGLVLLDFLVAVFVTAGAPIRLAIDDTLFGRSGRRVFGAHYLHDGAQPEGSGRRTRWGNCWVVVVLVVQPDCLGAGRSGCRSCSGCFDYERTLIPIGARSPSWRGCWSTWSSSASLAGPSIWSWMAPTPPRRGAPPSRRP